MNALTVIACVLVFVGAAQAADDPSRAATLLARYATLKDELADNRFHRPLHLDSSESPGGVTGEIHALVDHPFATAAAALGKPSQWCEVLSLHLNTKYCRPSSDDQGAVLHVRIGKKHDEPVEDAYRVDFVHRVAAKTANYLQVTLGAEEGPLGTRDYRIVLEVVPAESGRTFIRLAYAYSYGGMGKLAMQTYLATVAREKVGFTVVGQDASGQPRYVSGMRGVVERNTMRYYLAIDAYLGALSAPAAARAEKSRRDWFASSEAYARQLHEVKQAEYLDMKRKEHARQQIALSG